MIVEVIGHRYTATEYEGRFKTEVAVVALADILSRRAGFGRGGENGAEEEDALVAVLDWNGRSLDRSWMN